MCEKCTKKIDDEDEGTLSIECETCLNWFHLDCTDLIKQDLNTITKKGIHWFCDQCEAVASPNFITRLKAVESRIEKSYDQVMGSFNNRMTAVESQLTSLFENHVSKSEKTFASVVAKLEDSTTTINRQLKTQEVQIKYIKTEISSESRAKNIIVFGIFEKHDTTLDESIGKLSEVLDSCSLSFHASRDNATRLGQKKVDKIRPMRLTLASEVQKWEFLKRIKAQKIEGVFARLDLADRY